MKTEIEPRLTLVGAGPGDPDLLTIKGYHALRKAKVVLYDALVDPVLLNHAESAVKINVGKRKGDHIYTQQTINELSVKYALKYGRVVRLKGGDPFVFGRAVEEIEYAGSHGVPVDIVPGISSAIAVPAQFGIPLTERYVAGGFSVITATTSGGGLNHNIEVAIQSHTTLVILMGLSKLNEIINIFTAKQLLDYPVAIIQNGTTGREKMVHGTVRSIQSEVIVNNIEAPAIIVLGEVVRHVSHSKQFERQFSGHSTLYSNLIPDSNEA